MYNFNNFITEVKGDNGIVLLNLYDGSYVSLTAKEALELHLIMNSVTDIVEEDFIKNLIKDKWIVRSDFRYCMDEPHSRDYQLYDGLISDFELRTAIIELSTTCSLNCNFCNADSSKINISCFCKRWNYKPLEYNYNELIQQLNYYKVKEIYIMGGDPFFSDYDFDKMLCFINLAGKINKNIKIGIMVNGYSIKEEQLKRLKFESNIYFNILFVGCCDDDYTKIAGRENAFSTIKNNVKMIKKYNFPIIGTLLISSLEMLDKPLKIGIPITQKYLFDEKHNDTVLLKNYRERLMKIDYVLYQYTKKINSCLYSKIFIASNQKVYPCPGLRDFELGNLQMETLAEILQKGEYIEYWFLSKDKIFPCKYCKYRLQCFDCRALEYSKSGDINYEYYCKEAEIIMNRG